MQLIFNMVPADQHFFFRLLNCVNHFKPVANFSDCTGWFVSQLVANTKNKFSQDKTYIWCAREADAFGTW